MQVAELLEGVERNWNVSWDKNNPAERAAVLKDWKLALINVRPENLARAWERTLQERDRRQGHPLPGDILKLIGRKPQAAGTYTRNMKEFLEYVDRRAPEIIEDWKARNPELWQEAVKEGWEYWLLKGDDGFRDRADMLAQMEYGLQNEGATIVQKKAGNHQLRDEEIRDAVNGVLQLAALEGQIDRCRRIARAPKQTRAKAKSFKRPQMNRLADEARRAAFQASQPAGEQQDEAGR